ncbi:hypothetical protein ABK040_015429 [Willaertia magna]
MANGATSATVNKQRLGQQQLLLYQLPIETLQVVIEFLIGNLDLNEITEQYFKNNNSFHFELPSLQNVLTLISFTNVNKGLLQKSSWFNTFWKTCCNTLDFIYYYNLNSQKRNEDIEGGDLFENERTEICDIHKLILFSELGIVIDVNNKENDRFCKEWYNLENAKKYFTKRIEILIEDKNNIKEEENNYFISFLTKILHLIAPIINAQNDYWHYTKYYENDNSTNTTLNERILINVTKYLQNRYFIWDCKNVVALGLVFGGSDEIFKRLKEKKQYLKLKRALQNVFYLSINYDFIYWDWFKKDTIIFNNILILNITLNNNKFDLTDILFNNVRYLTISSDDNYTINNGNGEYLVLNLLQKKNFPKLNHLVIEGEYFTNKLKYCNVFESLEKLEIRCKGSDDFRNGNKIFEILKDLLQNSPRLKFCVIPQCFVFKYSKEASQFENVKEIYNLNDRNCVFSIHNDSYTFFYNYYYDII